MPTINDESAAGKTAVLGVPALEGLALPEVGRLANEFVRHLVSAAEDYCVQQAIEAVRAGFAKGVGDTLPIARSDETSTWEP